MKKTQYKLAIMPSGRCYLTLRGSRTIGPLSESEARERLTSLRQ